jgi:hypothetical protein
MTKEKPLYRQILKEALTTIWRHKFLWFFGLFATFLGSSGGEYDLLVTSFLRSSGDKPLTWGLLDIVRDVAATGLFQAQTLGNIKKVMIESPLSFFISILILALLVGITIFVIWLIIISQISLFRATKKIKEGSPSDLHQEIKESQPCFWPVFALNLINKFIVWILLILVGLVVFTSAVRATLLTMLLFILAFIIFISLAIFIAFVTKYAICYVIFKKQKWFAAIKSALGLFFANWVVSLEMALSLFVIDLVVKVLFVSLVLLLTAPVLMLGILTLFLNLKISFWLTIIVPILLFSILLFIIAGGLTAFQYSCWTLLFLKLTSKKAVVSKIARLASSLSEKVMGG